MNEFASLAADTAGWSGAAAIAATPETSAPQ